ncbi:hypothetical protein SKAU_G00385170 [Synaphobranchus kaupii]|uniref:Uncharacterized protein n=1 Tax=Synaphobranchus kaupii TaxID=118154 RepID=A0A9Q1EEF2_SYNKA|nr:hypothetical protein SKAU_G00385170 [Synaphobranchus kaupii]
MNVFIDSGGSGLLSFGTVQQKGLADGCGTVRSPITSVRRRARERILKEGKEKEREVVAIPASSERSYYMLRSTAIKRLLRPGSAVNSCPRQITDLPTAHSLLPLRKMDRSTVGPAPTRQRTLLRRGVTASRAPRVQMAPPNIIHHAIILRTS